MLEEEREQEIYVRLCNVLCAVSDISDTYEVFRKKRMTVCDYQGVRAEYIFILTFKDIRKVAIIVEYRGHKLIVSSRNLTTEVATIPLDGEVDFLEHLDSITSHFDKWLQNAIKAV